MNESIEEKAEEPMELVVLALSCLGFFVALGGVIVASAGFAALGLILLALTLPHYWMETEATA